MAQKQIGGYIMAKNSTATKEIQKAVMKVAQQIYIGPNIKGVVKSGTSFRNGLPTKLKEKITEQPILEKLIVSVEELAQAQSEIKEKGTVLNTVYEKVAGGVE